MATLIAKSASPSVRITSGSVISVRIGLTIVFAIPSTAAPRSNGHQCPMCTLSKIASATANERMLASQARTRNNPSAPR